MFVFGECRLSLREPHQTVQKVERRTGSDYRKSTIPDEIQRWFWKVTFIFSRLWRPGQLNDCINYLYGENIYQIIHEISVCPIYTEKDSFILIGKTIWKCPKIENGIFPLCTLILVVYIEYSYCFSLFVQLNFGWFVQTLKFYLAS